MAWCVYCGEIPNREHRPPCPHAVPPPRGAPTPPPSPSPASGTGPPWGTFIGFGRHLYGAADRASDGTHVATLWVVGIFLPVFPLRSYRVLHQTAPERSFWAGGQTVSRQYSVIPVPLHTQQVKRVYGVTAGAILIFVIPSLLGVEWLGGILVMVPLLAAWSYVRKHGSG